MRWLLVVAMCAPAYADPCPLDISIAFGHGGVGKAREGDHKGPSRKYAWLGRLRNHVDWTDGCIAVATDDAIDEIDEIATWAARAKPARVIIR